MCRCSATFHLKHRCHRPLNPSGSRFTFGLSNRRRATSIPPGYMRWPDSFALRLQSPRVVSVRRDAQLRLRRFRSWYFPFASLTADPANQYFSDGLTDEITDLLSCTRGLRVVARSSAFQFKGKTVDIREVGRLLNVDNVLEGSVEPVEDR